MLVSPRRCRCTWLVVDRPSWSPRYLWERTIRQPSLHQYAGEAAVEHRANALFRRPARVVEKLMLNSKEGRGGASGDANLVVDMLEMVAPVFSALCYLGWARTSSAANSATRWPRRGLQRGRALILAVPGGLAYRPGVTCRARLPSQTSSLADHGVARRV